MRHRQEEVKLTARRTEIISKHVATTDYNVHESRWRAAQTVQEHLHSAWVSERLSVLWNGVQQYDWTSAGSAETRPHKCLNDVDNMGEESSLSTRGDAFNDLI